MAFIDVHNYYGAQEPKSTWEQIQPIANILIGAGLAIFGTYIQRFVERRLIGKNYTLQVEGLKTSIIKQLQSMNDGIKVYREEAKVVPMSLFHQSKYHTIRNLDRLKLVMYMKWQEPYKSKENPPQEASERISSILYSFDMMAEQARTLEIYTSEFLASHKKLVANYAIEFNKLRRSIANYLNNSLARNANQDVLADLFNDKINSLLVNDTLSFEVIMNMFQATKDIILPVSQIRSGIVFDAFNEFIHNSTDTVQIYKSEEREFYDKSDNVFALYKTAFKNIYSEEVDKYLK